MTPVTHSADLHDKNLYLLPSLPVSLTPLPHFPVITSKVNNLLYGLNVCFYRTPNYNKAMHLSKYRQPLINSIFLIPSHCCPGFFQLCMQKNEVVGWGSNGKRVIWSLNGSTPARSGNYPIFWWVQSLGLCLRRVESILSPYIFQLSILHDLKSGCTIRHSLNLLHLPFM